MASIANTLNTMIATTALGSDGWFENFDGDNNGELSVAEMDAAADTPATSMYAPGGQWQGALKTYDQPLSYEKYCELFPGSHTLTQSDFSGSTSGTGNDSNTGTIVGIIGGVLGVIGVALAAIFAFGDSSTTSTTPTTPAEPDTGASIPAAVTDPEEDDESTLV